MRSSPPASEHNSYVVVIKMKVFLETAKKIFEEIKNCLPDIDININDIDHIVISSLHGTIIENASSCFILFKKNHFTGIPILLRNMLEAYVDLKNIKLDNNYSNSMNLSFLIQKKKLLVNIIKSSNKKYPHSKKIIEFKNALSDTEKYIKALKNDGHKTYKIFQRFNKAQLSDLYDWYNILCQESHNNISMLEKRHVIKKGNEIDKVVYFRKISIDEKYQLIHFITWLLLYSFREIQEYFDLKETINTNNVVELADKFSEQEMKYFKNAT